MILVKHQIELTTNNVTTNAFTVVIEEHATSDRYQRDRPPVSSPKHKKSAKRLLPTTYSQCLVTHNDTP